MNWIERVFGIVPDGGNGSAECGVAIAIALIVILGFVGRKRIHRAAVGGTRSSR